jgi:hypothetical protein
VTAGIVLMVILERIENPVVGQPYVARGVDLLCGGSKKIVKCPLPSLCVFPNTVASRRCVPASYRVTVEKAIGVSPLLTTPLCSAARTDNGHINPMAMINTGKH